MRKAAYIIASLAVMWILFSSLGKSQKPEEMNNVAVIDSVRTEKGKFLNLEPTQTMVDFKWSTMKEFMKKGNKVPSNPLPIDKFDSSLYANRQPDVLSVVWFGHSCALIEANGLLILTDPVFSVKAGPGGLTGPRRFHDQIPVSAGQLPALDVVLISHDHFDHLDKRTISALIPKTKLFVVPQGIAPYLRKWGVENSKIRELVWGDQTEVSGTRFISTPARHFSGRGLFNRNTTLWTSWVIKGNSHSVYFSGDSGYQKAFAEIGAKYGPFDLSLLECGQYNDDWGLIHMSPEESAQAGMDVQSKLAIPIHWGTFKLSVHSWTEPAERFSTHADSIGLRYATPRIGQHILINDHVATEKWWDEIKP